MTNANAAATVTDDGEAVVEGGSKERLCCVRVFENHKGQTREHQWKGQRHPQGACEHVHAMYGVEERRAALVQSVHR